MMWDWVGCFFFTSLLLQPLRSSHCKLSHAPAEKKGEEIWVPSQTSPTSLMLMEMTKSHLLSSEAVGEAGEEGFFRAMIVQKMEQEVLSCTPGAC